MNLPTPLVSQIREGQVVLLLGAGASSDAVSQGGRSAPSTKEMAEYIAGEFLSDSSNRRELAHVAELAISETSLPQVQRFIAGMLEDLGPTEAHQLLPSFHWHGLATTNYDRLVESAYDQFQDPLQDLAPILSDSDSMESAQSNPDSVALLKLHGCLTRPDDSSLPFILTPNQYVTHRRHREHLFRTLQEWGSDHTLVAIGHSLDDIDLRQVLLELNALGSSRPRFYLVAPKVTEEECRLWESRRITPLVGTFAEFLLTLDASIPDVQRQFRRTTSRSHPIVDRIARPLLSESIGYLNNGAEYVSANMSLPRVRPGDFYRGICPRWSGVSQDLDVQRRVADTIVCDVVLADESDRATEFELYVVLAEAGAGKSVCLQRIAWEAATDANQLCLYVDGQGFIDCDAIADIARATSRRLFVFVDDAADHVRDLSSLVTRATKDDLLITILAAERQNEWNISCESLDPFVTNEFNLQYLNPREISELLRLLDQHQSLGYLERLNDQERIDELQVRAGRQLLVALLEATQGRSFEDILVDEFEGIVPERAQSLYLTVCVLNRLGIPVRAGLISRIHRIPFKQFQDQLFEPLEHVVRVNEDWRIRDHVYMARHELIAQVVFERILSSPELRFEEYLRLIQALNLSYETDRSAFRGMVRGRVINELFANNYYGRSLFDAAEATSPDDAHVLHQRAIYEMVRTNGELNDAYDLLTRASRLAPGDLSIVHSLAELERKRAELTTSDAARERHRRQAMRLAQQLQRNPVHGAYGFHTIIKTQMDRLSDFFAETSGEPIRIDQAIQNIERTIANGLQHFPGNEYLLASEADFAEVLRDQERARSSLREAFDRNPRSPYIATRLARIYKSLDRIDDAVDVLATAVSANPNERRLHFAYAMILRDSGHSDHGTILHHLRHSRASNREDPDPEFWYACYLFMKGSSDSIASSLSIFDGLNRLRLSYHDKVKIRAHFVSEGRKLTSFTGKVTRREDSYGWITRDGVGDRVLVHSRNLPKEDWRAIRQMAKVSFDIGFNYKGPAAINVKKI